MNLYTASKARQLSYRRVKGDSCTIGHGTGQGPDLHYINPDILPHSTVVEHHALAALLPGRRIPVPTEKEAGRPAEPGWSFWRKVSR